MGSPCPDIELAHLVTAFTLNTACGEYESESSSSVLASPFWTSAVYMSALSANASSSSSSSLSGRFRPRSWKNRYGIRSRASLTPSKLFSKISRFLTVAWANGTDTAGPASAFEIRSTNCTRMEPSGMGAGCCCIRAFSAASSFCRLDGGGRTVAMASFLRIRSLAVSRGPLGL